MLKKILKKRVWFLGVLIGVVLVEIWAMERSNMEETGRANRINEQSADANGLEMEIMAYLHNVKYFKMIEVEDIYKKIENKEKFLLYTGRMTCQWCRKVVPIFGKIVRENNMELYYLDSEETENDENVKRFREQYNIKTVPSLICFEIDGSNHIVEYNIESNDLESELKNQIIKLQMRQ